MQFCVIDIQLKDAEVKFDYTLDGRRVPMELMMPMALANPVVTPLPSPEESYDEGCLSFPEIRGHVVRPSQVRVTYQDLDGQSHELVCGGILARCVQHETDHLNGVLFIDRMAPAVVRKIEVKVKQLKRETREFLRHRPKYHSPDAPQ